MVTIRSSAPAWQPRIVMSPFRSRYHEYPPVVLLHGAGESRIMGSMRVTSVRAGHERWGASVWVAVALLATCLMGAGCESAGLSARNFTVRRFAQVEHASVFSAAALALRESGYQIDQQQSRPDVLRTYPLDPTSESDVAASDGFWTGLVRGRPGALLGRRRARRNVATTHVRRTEDTITVYCRVEIQERATEAHRLWTGRRRLSDLPTDTPIDRDEGTAPEHSAVWRKVRRDKTRERSILDIISQLMSESVTLPRAAPLREPR